MQINSLFLYVRGYSKQNTLNFNCIQLRKTIFQGFFIKLNFSNDIKLRNKKLYPHYWTVMITYLVQLKSREFKRAG